ncbi:MAG: MBOAT family O-acyltransferase [Luteolibacter sp.]
MNFASYDFWSLLIRCAFGSWLLIAIAKAVAPAQAGAVGKVCLATTGLVLLGSESWLTLGVFLWVVGLSWIGVLIASSKGFEKTHPLSKLVFVVLLIGQLAPLFYFKYWDFVMNDCLGLGLKRPSVLIPMGLSFYTFQKIGFWIDTIRNPGSRPKFLDYLNFCSFFPQIVAGPIEKRASLLPQIETIQFKIDRSNLEAALQWIVLGLAYKLIVADNIGNLSGKLLIDPSNAWQVWFECFAFAIRIYFDFAGYSFIAVGLGLLLGVKLTLNFRCPYWSSDLKEFWRNWHVTLGAWLRDYVYLPLGGRRSPRWMLNIVIVFLVSGIWHGAGWGFLIWGLMHGIGVAFCGIGKPWTRLGWLRGLFTFGYTTAAWLFFFESNPDRLKTKAISLFNPFAYAIHSLQRLPQVFPNPTHGITFGMILVLAFGFLALEFSGVKKNLQPYHFSRKPAVCMVLVFLTILLAPMEESQFIYFNF